MRNVLIFILLLTFLVGCQTTPKVKEEPKEGAEMEEKFDWCSYLDEEWWCKDYVKTNPDFGETSLDIIILPYEGKLTAKESQPISIPIKVENNSSESISMKLTHEWHGGRWPPTDLYGFVLGKEGKWRGIPVYLLGENPNVQPPVTLPPKDNIEIDVRLDWRGTGSVKANPLIGDFGGVREGNYRMRFVLVFETPFPLATRNLQYVASNEVELKVE